MKTNLSLAKAALVLAISLTFSCSSGSDDPPSGGTSSQSGGGEISSSSSGGGSSSSAVSSSGTGGSSSSIGDGVSSSSVGGGGSSSNTTTAAVVQPCPNATTTAVDAEGKGSVSCGGKTYNTIKIDSQVWFAKNLNFAVEGSECYNELDSNCETYGRLYNWETANIVCPSGWHLPNDAEWDILYRYADGTSGTGSPYKSETAGTKLKDKTGWNPANGIPAGTDNFGFSALPGGRYWRGYFDGVGDLGFWWSASEWSSDDAIDRHMAFHKESAEWNSALKSELLSVRCIKDL